MDADSGKAPSPWPYPPGSLAEVRYRPRRACAYWRVQQARRRVWRRWARRGVWASVAYWGAQWAIGGWLEGHWNPLALWAAWGPRDAWTAVGLWVLGGLAGAWAAWESARAIRLPRIGKE